MQWCPFWTLWPCSVLASWCWWRPPRAAWAWTRRPWAAWRRRRRGGRAWCKRSWRRTWATWRSGWSLWRKKLSNFTQVVYSIIKHIFSSSWYWCCWWFCFWCWCFLLVVGGWCPWKYIGEALFGDSDTEKSTLKEITWQGRWIYKKKVKMNFQAWFLHRCNFEGEDRKPHRSFVNHVEVSVLFEMQSLPVKIFSHFK